LEDGPFARALVAFSIPNKTIKVIFLATFGSGQWS